MTTLRETSVTRSAIYFFSGNFLSRFSGFLRDIVSAYFFGTHPMMAAFLVAFRLSNVLRRLFGEGTIAAGFIPFFIELEKTSRPKAAALFRDLIATIALLLLAVILLVQLGFFGVQWFSISPSNLVIIRLAQKMFFGLFFICLFALFNALLQCRGFFFLGAFSGTIFNFVWIATIFYFRKSSIEDSISYLAISVVFAFFFQWLFTAIWSFSTIQKELSWKGWFQIKVFSEDLQKMLFPLFAGIIGVGASQINSAFDVLFARFADLSGPAYLSYAMRLQQLPISLFAVSIASALLPKLSSLFAANQVEKFHEVLSTQIYRLLFLLIPCVLGVFSLGSIVVDCLFARGGFNELATFQTTKAFWMYALGLIPQSLVILLANSYFAKKDFKTPMSASILSVLFNILCNLFFVLFLKLGAYSVALASSLSAILNLALLYRKAPFFTLEQILKLMPIGFFALCAAFFAFGITYFSNLNSTLFFLQSNSGFILKTNLEKIYALLLGGGVFLSTYLVLTSFFYKNELIFLLNSLRKSKDRLG